MSRHLDLAGKVSSYSRHLTWSSLLSPPQCPVISTNRLTSIIHYNCWRSIILPITLPLTPSLPPSHLMVLSNCIWATTTNHSQILQKQIFQMRKRYQFKRLIGMGRVNLVIISPCLSQWLVTRFGEVKYVRWEMREWEILDVRWGAGYLHCCDRILSRLSVMLCPGNKSLAGEFIICIRDTNVRH